MQVPATVGAIGVGVIGVAAGYMAVSNLVRDSYRQDFSSDPRLHVDNIEGGSLQRINNPKGDSNGNLLTWASGALAGLGFAVAATSIETASAGATLVRGGGGIALFSIGLGGVVAAQMMINRYKGLEFFPDV